MVVAADDTPIIEPDDAMTLSMLESILADDLDLEPAVVPSFGNDDDDEDARMIDDAAVLPVLEEEEEEEEEKRGGEEREVAGLPAVVVVKQEESSSSSSESRALSSAEEKKKASKTKRADRKAALQNKQQQSPQEEMKAESKEDKKQRRLIRNRMSAQLHRERKKAYVDHLEGLVRERDDEIEKLKAQVQTLRDENAGLRSKLQVSVVSVDGTDESSDSDDSTQSRKRRKGPTRAAAALLTAVSCVALISTPGRDQPRTFELQRTPPRRALLSDAPYDDDHDVIKPDVIKSDVLAYLPDGSPEAAAAAWVYERDVARELFTFPVKTPEPPSVEVAARRPKLLEDGYDNRTRHSYNLRGAKAIAHGNATAERPRSREDKLESLAPYRGSSNDATSYVVCSSAAGVFGRSDDSYGPDEERRPHGALLSLPSGSSDDASFRTSDDFIQLLVPPSEVDLGSWGFVPDANDRAHSQTDLWLEVGAWIQYARLVRNIKMSAPSASRL
ncbi:hypothetical protein CTAYLR_000859 [Chrysophaeum taylorii]|uniref:BZIP domain-containing protein n=1 Tax=Chrysophaeum taylorii TaxID=2483200 RepID=A0AAD7XUX5_9STRA|nr:hypothetical protein CTAYLR_000859 [Chrysophaeum taylorii]